MLNNTDTVRVENRSRAIVGYKVPESNIRRRFVEGETKELQAGMINVCKENHQHSVINDSDEDLVIIGIVTKGA